MPADAPGAADDVRIGVRLPSTGPDPVRLGVPAMAQRLEAAGFDSLWVSDHVVMTATWDRSHYPFSDDGTMTWDPTIAYHDALTVLAMAAAVTTRVELGTAVLVLPLRQPVVLAKQVATLDSLSGGRVVLGVGVGWYIEELEALGVDPTTRGAAFDEAVELLRRLWTGTPAAFEGTVHQLPAGVIHQPVPARRVPLLVGGVSPVAVRRAATQGDGWLGLTRAGRLDIPRMAGFIAQLHDAAAAAGRPPGAMRVTLRIIESVGQAQRIAQSLPDLAAAGVDEVIVDADWSGDGDAEAVHAALCP